MSNLLQAQSLNTLQTCSRLANLAVAEGTVDLVNLVLANPSNFALNERNYIVGHTPFERVVTFFVIGSVQHSGLLTNEHSRQICVAPFRLTWPRCAAFIGAVTKQKTLHFLSYHRGLTFSMRTMSARG